MVNSLVSDLFASCSHQFIEKTFESQLEKLLYYVVSAAKSYFQSKEAEIVENPRPVVVELKTKPAEIFEGAAEEKTTEKAKAVSQRVGISLEEGDKPYLHDTLFNFIPASYFEVGTSLSILNAPGHSGVLMDQAAQELDVILDRVYNTDLGNQIVQFGKDKKSIRDIFNSKLLKELGPATDQIGRCTDETKTSEWLKGAGLEWLRKELHRSSQGSDHSVFNMLTKIRALSAFGTIIRDMRSSDPEGTAAIVGKDSKLVQERCECIMTSLRHKDFDTFATRGRLERAPIIGGKSMAGTTLLKAGLNGSGTDRIYMPESFGDDPAKQKLKEEYAAYIKAGNFGAIPRQGRVIDDTSRPGVITEFAHENMPESFKATNISELLEENKLTHGAAVNRWQLMGSYAREGWNYDLPAAGAQSGGTTDIFLALNAVSLESLQGNKEDVLALGLLIASFMNFGGYHSFVETFPIIQAFSEGVKFEVTVGEKQQKHLYKDVIKAIEAYAPEAAPSVKTFKSAYDQALKSVKDR